ncbi:MAG: family N-acetyltransferase [Clostridiaceae bacterium]|jgi:hypothetical protein|nr:family N-acetyltransferase [Clostridiaceae bacterium]
MKGEFRLLSNNDNNHVMDYFRKNPIETTFLYGNVVQFGLENNRNIRRAADYYGYFKDGDIKGILPFYNLGSCIPHYEDKDAIKYFCEKMKERDFSYLLGMANVINPLYEEIKEYKTILEYSDDSYFVNDSFKPFILKNIDIVNAKDLPVDKAVAFLQEVNEQGFNRISSRDEIIKTMNERGEEEESVVVLLNGKAVAHANIQTFTDKINQIGGVYTSKDYRGNGYCKAAVSEICSRILIRGKVPTLMVRKNNIPAVNAYKALGFNHYSDYLLISLK